MPNQFTKINVLFSDEDKERLDPILTELRNRGLQVSEAKEGTRQSEIILVALSKTFYEDDKAQEVLLNLLGKGAKNVLPVRLDDTTVPDKLKNVLYSRNIISASGRNVPQIADRIISAIPNKPSILPIVLIAASVVIAGMAGLFIWLANRPKPEPDPVPSAVTQDEIVIPATLEGLTDEDLYMITCVTILGDRFVYSTSGQTSTNLYSLAYDTYEEDGHHWYNKEDGHEYQMTHYDDLRFLELMPNLRNVSIALVDCDASSLPDLSDKLRYGTVYVCDCNIDSLDWLAGAKMEQFYYMNSHVKDFSPLTSCDCITYAGIDLYLQTEADMSSFAPPKLKGLRISNGDSLDSIDLSALSGLQELNDVELDNIPITDISFLANSGNLQNLDLINLRYLNDVTALSDMKNLEMLGINNCPDLSDFSSVTGCTSLYCFHINYNDNGDAIRDVSFLAELTELHELHCYGCSLNNLDFLQDIAENQSSINFGFAGDIGDYSGLAYIDHFEYLHVNPRNNDGGNGSDFPAVLPYIQDANIDFLELYDCAGLNLNELPDNVSKLKLIGGDFSDLTDLKPYLLNSLILENCDYLTSLEGIQNLSVLYVSSAQMDLEIRGCIRLTDYSALNDTHIKKFCLTGVYALPDFKAIRQIKTLKLESIEGFSDLSVLEGANSGYSFDLELIDLTDLYDLSPLKNIRGYRLTVPPQVADQAEELVELGNYSEYEVCYPDGSWSWDESEITLLSLSELETLPKPILKRVQRVAVLGDILIDLDEGWVESFRDENDNLRWQLHIFDSDEVILLEPGEGVITDINVFGDLENLRELYLYVQPLENINGIQSLSNLERLKLIYCPNLTDVSPAFACQQLQEIDLQGCPVESIQGVQNLPYLISLTISSTQVTDISPLKDVDYSYSEANGGFGLGLGATMIEDFSALSNVPVFSFIDLNDIDAPLFVNHLKGVQIKSISICNCFMGRLEEDPDSLFAEFCKDHTEIVEMCVSWNQELTDLTPLLNVTDLQTARVSYDMEDAMLSLEGNEYGFELLIES